jgi:uncharacterized repeat protein (TIGR03803 family)
MKTFRTAASLMLFGALIIASSADMSAIPRFGLDVVHSFAGAPGDGTPASSESSAALLQATDGNFYGTTYYGGASDGGSVYKMTPSGTVTILHSFTGGADGAFPLAGLIQATDTKFYGTTSLGGASNLGTVFTITADGTLTTLYNFSGPQNGAPGADGANPHAALLQTSDGNFYGTTEFGGTAGRGTLFVMSPAGAILGRISFTGGFDGAHPKAPLIQAADGSLYGTTYAGTTLTDGRVFRLAGGILSVVHTFAGGAADGANPSAAVVQANDGNFYGTTLFGGASDKGTAFKMTPDGTVTLLHSFSGGADGEAPYGALMQAADGNLYGTTRVGGASYGTIYKISLSGTFTVIHTFTGGAEGAVPVAPFIQAKSGRLYGTTSFGGAHNLGVVFRLPVGALGDVDGDGKADITVFRPSSSNWYMLTSGTNYSPSNATVVQWGLTNDVPAPGDYDGDGKTDPAVYRPSNGTWYILDSNTNYTTMMAIPWGVSTDVPVPADYDGDGKVDPAVYRPSTGQWFALYSSTNYTTYRLMSWGVSTDVPVQGDYDGDGKADFAVYRPSTAVWYVLQSSTNFTTYVAFQWGLSGDIAVPGDYDGDGLTDMAVFRPSNGTWYIQLSSTNNTHFVTFPWGTSGDVPVPADYDGDGVTDLAVFRPSTAVWYIRQSSTGNTTFVSYQWGLGGDTPINGRQ